MLSYNHICLMLWASKPNNTPAHARTCLWPPPGALFTQHKSAARLFHFLRPDAAEAEAVTPAGHHGVVQQETGGEAGGPGVL